MKKDMTQGREWKLIILFALPIMAANLLQQLYNTIDNVIVGNFAEKAAPGSFAAVSTSASLTFLYLSFAMGLGIGVSVVCAQLFGAKRERDLNAAIETGIILLFTVGVAVMILGLIFTPFLLEKVLSVHDSEIRRLATIYLRIYCLGLPFQFVYNAIASALRGVGDSLASLLFLFATAVVNVLLDLWFIVSFGWGVTGAAIATVIAQVICVLLSYIYLRRKFPFQRGARHFDGALCKSIVKIGLPTAVQQSIVSIGNVAVMRLVHHFSAVFTEGTAIVDAFGAGSRIDMFIFVPIIGLQSALASFTGQNIAARQIDRVKRGYYLTLATGLAATVALCLALYVYAEQIIGFFGLSADAVRIGSMQIRFYAKYFWIFSLYMLLGGVLQGAGDTLLQSAATLSALAIRVVVAYLGVFAFSWFGYEASWMTIVYGWIVALVITNIRFYTGGWMKKTIAQRGDAPLADGAARELPEAGD